MLQMTALRACLDGFCYKHRDRAEVSIFFYCQRFQKSTRFQRNNANPTHASTYINFGLHWRTRYLNWSI